MINKELFLAILKNDLEAVALSLAQKKKEGDEALKGYVNAGYKAEYQILGEVIAEIGKIKPQGDLAKKNQIELIGSLQGKEASNSGLDNMTPLTLATLLGRSEIAKLLLQNDANPNADCSVLGWNTVFAAYQYATITQNVTFLEYLVKQGMNLNGNFRKSRSHFEPHSITVLQLAIQHLNIPLVETLLSLKADPNGLSNWHATPIAALLFLSPAAIEITELANSKGRDFSEKTSPLAKSQAGDSKELKEVSETFHQQQQENQEKIVTIYKLLIKHGAILLCKFDVEFGFMVERPRFYNKNEGSLELPSAFPEIDKIVAASLYLHYAASGKITISTSTKEKLLKEGADFEHRLYDNETILQVAYKHSHRLEQFSEKESFAMSRSHDRDVFSAIIRNDAELLHKIFKKYRELINQRYHPYLNLESDIIRALKEMPEYDEAAVRTKTEIMEKFENASIVMSKDPNLGAYQVYAISTINITPLMLALLLGRLEIAKDLLVSNAADHCYQQSWTPLFFAYLYATFTNDSTMLKFLLQLGLKINKHLETLDFALSRETCTGLNMDSDCETILHHPVRNCNFRMVKLLLELGADINQTSYLGWTPLMALFDWVDPMKQWAENESDMNSIRQSPPEENEFNRDSIPDDVPTLDDNLIQKRNQMANFLIQNSALITKGGRQNRYHVLNYQHPPDNMIKLVETAKAGPKQVITAVHKLFMFVENKEAALIPESCVEKWFLVLEGLWPVRDESLNTPVHAACVLGNIHALRVFFKIMLKHKMLNHPVFTLRNKDQRTPLDCVINTELSERRAKQLRTIFMSYMVDYVIVDKAKAMLEIFTSAHKIIRPESKMMMDLLQYLGVDQEFATTPQGREWIKAIFKSIFTGKTRSNGIEGRKLQEMLANKAMTKSFAAEGSALRKPAEHPIPIPIYLRDEEPVQKLNELEKMPDDIFSPQPVLKEDLNNALGYAVRIADINLVEKLITLKADVNSKYRGYLALVGLFVPILKELVSDLRKDSEPKKSAEIKVSSEAENRRKIANLLIDHGAAVRSLEVPLWFKKQRIISSEKSIYLESFLPEAYRSLKLRITAAKHLYQFIKNPNSVFSTATVLHLIGHAKFPLPTMDLSLRTVLHEFCSYYSYTAHPRALKTLMRAFIKLNCVNNMEYEWTRSTLPYSQHEYPETPLDVALGYYYRKNKNSLIVMNFVQMFLINKQAAQYLAMFYQSFYSKYIPDSIPAPAYQIEEWVKQTCVKLIDYLGSPLANTPKAKAWVRAAYVKAFTSPILHKILQAKIAKQQSPVLRDEKPSRSLDFLDEDFTIKSSMIQYTNDGICIKMDEDMARKFSLLQEGFAALHKKHKKQDASSGDTKAEQENEKIASQKALTFIKEQIKNHVDIPLAGLRKGTLEVPDFENFVKKQLSFVHSELQKQLNG